MPDRFDPAKLVGAVWGRRCQRDPVWRWTRSIGGSCAATHALIQLFDPPFDKSDSTPATSKAMCPACGKTAASTPMPRIWAVMAFAALGDAARAWELFTMINPVSHADQPKAVDTYKVEPYVVAADVYAAPPHTGRGGWTWYTGSAGWMYRLIIESLLGLRLEVDILSFAPCLPVEWNEYKIHYRYRETVYHITVLQGSVGREEA